jgi:non-lysosomal glucosylceramidase
MNASSRPQWHLPAYLPHKTSQISFPLGGLGTGCVGLAGNGRLIDWEIANRPNKGSLNGLSHFAVKAERNGQTIDVRILHGDLSPPYIGEFVRESSFVDGFGFGPRRENLAGLPHFSSHSFRGEFPFAEIEFKDPAFPGTVSLLAFNPLIPLNEKDSGIPAAFFEIELTNNNPDVLDFTVVGVLSNPFVEKGCFNHVETCDGRTLLRTNPAIPGIDELSIATDAEVTSHQEYLYRGTWCDDLQVYWNELSSSSRFKNRNYPTGESNSAWTQKDSGLIAAHLSLGPNESRRVRFLISWYHPKVRNYWDKEADKDAEKVSLKNSWRNRYAVEWSNAKAVVAYAFDNWDSLLQQSVRFHDCLFASTLPPSVLDAVSANLSVLKSPTVSLLEDGTFYGWEGVGPTSGSCEGSCTHVWNYAMSLPFLFPRLERSMRDANYQYNIDQFGGAHFRLKLPLGRHQGTDSFRPCVDGQFGDVIKTYRDWKICGDTSWLAHHWPTIKKTVMYAWSPYNLDSWDPEKTGVLWGRQHHTLDMELFGPNSWLTGFYLGALKACVEMGTFLGDIPFADQCHELFKKGKTWTDAHLFNGNYFCQKIDIKDKDLIARYDLMDKESGVFSGNVKDIYWAEESKEIKYQIAEGCQIDAVVAQWHSNLCGLGELFDPKKVHETLFSIYRNNFETSSRNLPNPWRVFRLNEESGVTMCTWPREGSKPAIPLPYAQESMTGFEYAFASQLIQNGLVQEGVSCVDAIRGRYDGEKRNPWNEIECGSNYARSMASYSLLNAFSGFVFEATKNRIGFKPQSTLRPFKCFWSLGSAWGQVDLTDNSIRLNILHGKFLLREFMGPIVPSKVEFSGRSIPFNFEKECCALFNPILLESGDDIVFHA